MYTEAGVGRPPLEGNSFVASIATRTDYYVRYPTPGPYFKDGIWYHGFGQVKNQGVANTIGAAVPGQTNEESFTIKEDFSGGTPQVDQINFYRFYVRSFNAPISSLVNNKLRVDIYNSEDTYTGVNPNQMASPLKTFYLYNAAPSDNSNAKYWYVFSTTGNGTPWSACGGQYANTGLIVTDIDPADTSFCP